MTSRESSESGPAGHPIVHGLLVCRAVDTNAAGEVSLQNVLEVIPVDALPGDVGPLTFVAFVRYLPPGPGRAAFSLARAGPEGESLGRLPLELEVPPAYEGRQVALHVTLPSLPLEQGGWIDLVFEWNGEPVAANRFAVGAKG